LTLTAHEQVGALVSHRALSAFYADPRLEVLVPADGDVVVLRGAAVSDPHRPSDWDARVAAAATGSDLARG